MLDKIKKRLSDEGFLNQDELPAIPLEFAESGSPVYSIVIKTITNMLLKHYDGEIKISLDKLIEIEKTLDNQKAVTVIQPFLEGETPGYKIRVLTKESNGNIPVAVPHDSKIAKKVKKQIEDAQRVKH